MRILPSAWALLIAFTLTLAACVGERPDGFRCERAEQCASGRCETSGWCSAADASCPAGRRYDVSAAAAFADTCVAPATPVWLTARGGSDADQVEGLAARDGAVAAVASYRVDELALGDGLPVIGETDMAIARLQLADGAVSWARSWGSPGDDFITSVAFLDGGDVLAGGRFSGTQTFGTATPHVAQGSFDAFVVRLRSDGETLWASDAQTGAVTGVTAIAADPATGVFVAGAFNADAATPMRLGGTAEPLTTHGGIDAFVGRYTVAGVPTAARGFGGSQPDFMNGLVAGNGTVIAVGQFAPALEGFGAPVESRGAGDAFVVVFDANDLAAAPAVATFGGTGGDTATCAARGDGAAAPLAIGGSVQGMVDFGVCASCRPPPRGMRDGFVAHFANPANLVPQWVRRLGEDGTTEVLAIAHARDAVYVAGTFDGTLALDDGTRTTSAGGTDAFLVRLAVAGGETSLVAHFGGLGEDILDHLVFADGRLVFGGRFEQTAAIGDAQVTSAGGPDLFIGALDAP